MGGPVARRTGRGARSHEFVFYRSLIVALGTGSLASVVLVWSLLRLGSVLPSLGLFLAAGAGVAAVRVAQSVGFVVGLASVGALLMFDASVVAATGMAVAAGLMLGAELPGLLRAHRRSGRLPSPGAYFYLSLAIEGVVVSVLISWLFK